MDEPKKRGRKPRVVEQGNGADVAPVAVVLVAAPVAAASLPLIDYIKTKERDFPPLVEITHPDAADGGFHAGVYSGIRLKRGPCAALYSDSTTE